MTNAQPLAALECIYTVLMLSRWTRKSTLLSLTLLTVLRAYMLAVAVPGDRGLLGSSADTQGVGQGSVAKQLHQQPVCATAGGWG